MIGMCLCCIRSSLVFHVNSIFHALFDVGKQEFPDSCSMSNSVMTINE